MRKWKNDFKTSQNRENWYDMEDTEKHIEKHNEKENQQSITKPFAPQEFRNIFFPGKSQLIAQQVKELTSAAEFIAVHFIPAKNGNEQRNEEAQQPNPCKENIEKS